MIIRKPYAFLIKNFKKIHIFLFILAIYIYFKSTQIFSFLSQFIQLQSYDIYNEPISNYVSFFGMLALLILIVGSGALLLLLRKKDKPWKLYLIPVIQYSLLLLTFMFVKGYFTTYTGVESASPMRAWRDILLVSQIIEIGCISVYIIRIFGIDLKKFNFKLDEEYLELDQGDKEELEISLNIDKDSFKRTYKRFLRNSNYFYQEHKLLCRLVILIILLLLGRNSLNYINAHKSYKEGDTFDINGYTVKINNSYYTDKSYNGEIISKKSSFVIVDASITNNAGVTREANLDRYHIINGVSNYSPTTKTYETEFKDLGKAYDTLKLSPGKEGRVLLIFKVDNTLKKNRFVLYYQELRGNEKNLRKIKLKLTDVSEVKVKEELSLGDNLQINIKNEEENIMLEYIDIESYIDYTFKTCTTLDCKKTSRFVEMPSGYKSIKIAFGSDTYEGNELSKIMEEYGKLTYTTKDGKQKSIKIDNILNTTYYGKFLYIKVPDEAAESPSVSIDLIVRNNKYIYKIIEK